MSADEIIEMWNSVIKYAPSEVRITEFAKLVAAKEREACEKICEAHAKVYLLIESPVAKAAWAACIDNRDAIRAREQA
jgi:hypothetical protein